MSDQSESKPDPTSESGGLSVSGGRDVNVGGDVAGRDVVKTTTTVTNVGLDAKALQRLLLSVGALVFATTLCAFVSGAAVMFAGLRALDRPVNSNNPQAAAEFAASLTQLQTLQPGQKFEFGFTEEQISSYFRLVVAPRLGIKNGKVRFLDEPGALVIGGEADQLGGRAFAAQFQADTSGTGRLTLTAASVQVINTNSPLGWVAVPPGVLQNVGDQVNNLLDNAQLNRVEVTSGPTEPPAWVVSGTTR